MPNTERTKIIFDASPLRYLHTGLGQFTYHLIKAFRTHLIQTLDVSFLIHPSSKHLVAEFTQEFVTATRLKRHAPPFLFPALFGRYDLWHVTSENTRFTHFSKSAKILLTLHGLHFLDEDPPHIAKKKLEHVQRLVNRSNALATDSVYTERLVRKHLDIGQRPIRVIHLGVENDETPVVKKPAHTPEHGFIFSIGNFFERKNFHVLLPFLHLLEGYTMVLAGHHSNPYGDRIKEEIHRLGLSQRVFLTGEVSESEKHWLFQNCSAFVFPSVSEGFGIPVIEAMRAGKPVFCSLFGSLPEIGGPHAFYWKNFEAIYMKDFFLEKIRSYYHSREHEINAKQYANGFSWGKAAEGYLSYYTELIE